MSTLENMAHLRSSIFGKNFRNLPVNYLKIKLGSKTSENVANITLHSLKMINHVFDRETSR